MSSAKSGDSSQRPKGDTYFLMLKVTPEKEVAPVKWALSNLDENTASLVIDEPNERLYLWIGQSVDGITKAVARRRAVDISSQGFKLESVSYPIGKVMGKKLQMLEIDQAEMNKDPKLKETFNDLKTLFRKKTELSEEGVLARSGVKIPEAKRELSQGFTRPPPQFQDVSKALEEKFGRAPEIIAERETMLERYREREYDKVAARYALAFIDVLGGKANIEISSTAKAKTYQVSRPAVTETQVVPNPETASGTLTTTVIEEKKCSFVIEDKKLKILESNLSQEEINRVMRRAEELV
jgi:hypothetical protein